MRDKFITSDLEAEIFKRFDQLQEAINVLAGRQVVKDFYSVQEFSKIVARDNFTVREWCRHGRILAEKKRHGRGRAREWVISHKEKCRYDAEGLLPPMTNRNSEGGDTR